MLWTPNGLVTNNLFVKKVIIPDNNKTKYIKTTGFSNFLVKANNLKGKYPTEEYCKMYVVVSLQQYKSNNYLKCKLEKENDSTHPRWHNNIIVHSRYCKKYSVYASNKLVRERETALRVCATKR